jgi:spore coat protein JB
MPESMQKPNMGLMPESMQKPNMGLMPESMQKPNMGLMPEMMNKSNVAGLENANVAGEMINCGYKNGELPPCAPLAAGFVPWQQKNPPKYGTGEALPRGTLFPGLDLPWKNIVNNSHPYAGTPLGELMAIDFAIKELNLYLDTHERDKEAFDMLKTLIRLSREGRERYVKLYGPLNIKDLENAENYTWTRDPWPWEYAERMGKD